MLRLKTNIFFLLTSISFYTFALQNVEEMVEQCMQWDGKNADSLLHCSTLLLPLDLNPRLDAYRKYLLGRVTSSEEEQKLLFAQAIRDALDFGDYHLAAQAHYRYGRVFSSDGIYDSAMHHYQLAHSLFDKDTNGSFIDSKRRKCVVYTSQAYISNQLNGYEESIGYSLSALRIAEQFAYHELRLVCLINLSASYGELASPDNRIGTSEEKGRYKNRAKFYMFQAAALADMIGDNRRAHGTYGNIGTYYVYENKLDSARFYLNKAISIGEMIEDQGGLANDYNMLSLLFKKSNQLDSAIHYGYLAMENARETGLHHLEADMLLTLAELSISQNQFDEAGRLLTRSLKMSKELGMPKITSHAFDLLHNLKLRTGDTGQALDYYKQSILYRDSVASLKNLNRIEELETQFEAEKKERQIDNLEKKAAISKLKIKQQRLLLLGVLILLFFAGIAAFYIYRNKNLRAAHQRMIVEQKLLRSQMNPHFLFNALSSVHGYIYEGDQKKAAEYLSMFSELTREILNYSSNELILLVEELETLQKYVNLQQLRFPKVSYEVICDEAIDSDNILVPPMLFQPFVENAIEHGFRGQKGGNIKIAISKTSNFLRVEIEDDGVGLDENKFQKSGLHAVEITRERISLLPGMKKNRSIFSIQSKNKNGKTGVLIILNLPILEAV
ncbi:MAG: histidine kinase [Cyclobacteriaceae bacterium]